ncbi:hypothetical protein IT575_14290 [bacterium]|nr:hypothetical protein [bacterium]
MRCKTTLFGYELSCASQPSRFALLVRSNNAGVRDKEQWVVCHRSSANLFGFTILKSTPRYEGLPFCLETAARMLDGRQNSASGEFDKLPLSNAGRSAFLTRLLEASRLGQDSRLADSYLLRSTAVLWNSDHPAEPDEFPTVKEALDGSSWNETWEPRTRAAAGDKPGMPGPE